MTSDPSGASGLSESGSVRVDAWIWSVRLLKTRSAAAAACRAGHVRVNGERAKPAQPVKAGDEVRLRAEHRERVVIVKKIIRKRVGAPVAVECYQDNSPPPPPREAVAPAGIRDRGAGRPTKRDRREMERLRGPASPDLAAALGAFDPVTAEAPDTKSGRGRDSRRSRPDDSRRSHPDDSRTSRRDQGRRSR
ncbi:RNA-binding S4 domain-containing protein [Streptomyces sp. TRM66268-LWL]|uniref:RNA-binding S4 domain-containing protein n=1 Tax=Streptomyces polyasparticus TaxID=2767826 RepID=A0ABR7S9G5_9ACTN|nr:RNA-binding S4 domain-containing protein [Streptomyces polyasparticus]MBC9712053.1 RNA-binding S4 domain-containing protein [Streptomyces polyasparticus]